MSNKTVLNEFHHQSGGRMVDFAGWELPLHYGSQIAEHAAVRTAAGMFDVSHMGIIDVSGQRSYEFMRHLLSNDVARLPGPGSALYSCMLNPSGGILDDVVAYWVGPEEFRIVVNAGPRDRDLAWITRQAVPFDVAVRNRKDLAMIAVQGPRARAMTATATAWLPVAAPSLAAMRFLMPDDDYQVSRTGYTGEDGYELVVPEGAAVMTWKALLGAGVVPCGLGARDSLRLEAGLRLYGSDMDETVSPFDCGLAWTVALEPESRSFIGREGLQVRHRDAPVPRFVGLILEEPGVLRGQLRVVLPGGGEGVTTSGGYSPTLHRSIGFARVPPSADQRCVVEIRGNSKSCRIVPPRFVRHGRLLVTL